MIFKNIRIEKIWFGVLLTFMAYLAWDFVLRICNGSLALSCAGNYLYCLVNRGTGV